LALQVYRQLGQLIHLPVRIPQQVLDQVAAGAGPAELASAGIAAEQTLAALRQLIDGQAPFPPWTEEGLPEEESLAIIEAALKAGQGLQMSYYTAGRDELTHRLVEPHRLEWHGRRGTTEPGSRGAGES
jgi:predicted DNA-binding transcriptional regulator YafY